MPTHMANRYNPVSTHSGQSIACSPNSSRKMHRLLMKRLRRLFTNL